MTIAEKMNICLIEGNTENHKKHYFKNFSYKDSVFYTREDSYRAMM